MGTTRSRRSGLPDPPFERRWLRICNVDFDSGFAQRSYAYGVRYNSDDRIAPSRSATDSGSRGNDHGSIQLGREEAGIASEELVDNLDGRLVERRVGREPKNQVPEGVDASGCSVASEYWVLGAVAADGPLGRGCRR